jgi:hypothetical protein
VAPPPSPAPVRAQRRKTVKTKSARSRKSTPVRAKRTVPALGATKSTESSSPDTTLLIGGLALVVLVLGDTIFLSLSTRIVRPG